MELQLSAGATGRSPHRRAQMILATGAPTRWPGRLALPLGGRCRPCRCALGDEDDWGRGAQNSAGRADSEPTR